MRRKIFVGISVPEDIKKRLFKKMEKWKELPVKWAKEDSFHVTLSFLGYVEDEALVEICAAVKEASKNFESFDIDFEKIELGPDKKNPNLIWATGETDEDLKKIQEEIEKALDIFVAEKKAFRPHIMLGRIRKLKWETLPEVPKVEENYKFTIPVESVEVFESKAEKGGTAYDILESCELK
jgi:2'-5' RNA ligase